MRNLKNPSDVPQPALHRLPTSNNQALVCGVMPQQSDLVAITAARMASALKVPLYFAYVDPRRVVLREHGDGRVLDVWMVSGMDRI